MPWWEQKFSINPGEVVKGGAMLYPQTEKELEKEKYEDD